MKKKYIKILIVVFIILILIFAIILANTQKKYKLAEYVETKYNYFAMYSIDDKVGVIDRNGKLILDATYTDVIIPNPSKDVFFVYENASDYKILNSKGEELFTNYEKVEAMQTSELSLDFEKVFLKFEKNGKYGLIDFAGNQIVSAEYDSIESLKYRPGEILVKKDDKYGVIASDGKIKIKPEYDEILGDEYYTDKYGYGQTGYIVGIASNSGYLYGYLNNYGEKILDTTFESISRVLKYDDSNIYLIVMNNGKKGVYKNAKNIIAQNYQTINYNGNSNIFVVKRSSKYGIFSVDGKSILDVKYTAYSLAGDYISVENEAGEKELYDVKGNKVSNLNYKSVQASRKFRLLYCNR